MSYQYNIVVSNEQQIIIDNVINGHNVQVDACAGSGKSTTIFSTVARLPHKRFILLTYNKSLRLDAILSIESRGLKNVEAHTFHSLAVKYYLSEAHTDCGIRKIVYTNMPPRTTIPPFHILALDETQDMSFLYFQLMSKFVKDAGTPIQLFVLGDYKQCLYEFKGADPRFLTHFHRAWEKHPMIIPAPFVTCKLSTSYRITDEMAAFVNHVMLGETRLIATRTENKPVVYITNSRVNIENTVVYHIRQLIESGAATPADIFVLGASTRGGKMKRMENVLVERDIPCHVPIFESEEIDDKVIDGKIVFSTFHSVKGRQRKYVLIVGFDNSYFNFYARDADPDICPNTLYVGCTRATHQLFLLETSDTTKDRPLPFLRLNHHEMKQQPYITFKGNPKLLYADQISAGGSASDNEDELMGAECKTDDGIYEVTPTSLIRFLPETLLMKLAPLLDSIFVSETPELTPDDEIPTPNIIQTSGGMHEEVSDLNGIAIPSIYYDHLHSKHCPDSDVSIGSAILWSHIQWELDEMRPNEHKFLKSVAASLPAKYDTPADYLFLANVYMAVKERVYFKVKQIAPADYNWLRPDLVKRCVARLDKIIGQECRKEKPQIEHTIVDKTDKTAAYHDMINGVLSAHFPGKKFRFTARADLITEKCLWELKCTSILSEEHRLQLIIYDWLWRIVSNTMDGQRRKTKNCPMLRRAKLVNIKSGEILRIEATFEQLTEIVVELLKSKYVKEPLKTDEELWEDCDTYVVSMSTMENAKTTVSNDDTTII